MKSGWHDDCHFWKLERWSCRENCKHFSSLFVYSVLCSFFAVVPSQVMIDMQTRFAKVLDLCPPPLAAQDKSGHLGLWSNTINSHFDTWWTSESNWQKYELDGFFQHSYFLTVHKQTRKGVLYLAMKVRFTIVDGATASLKISTHKKSFTMLAYLSFRQIEIIKKYAYLYSIKITE